jgi:hypothetical protein
MATSVLRAIRELDKLSSTLRQVATKLDVKKKGARKTTKGKKSKTRGKKRSP